MENEYIQIIVNGMIKEVKNPVQGIELIALAGFKVEDSEELIIRSIKLGCKEMGRLHHLDYVTVDKDIKFGIHR